MTSEDKKSNQFETNSEYEVKEQQQFWNRYMNPGYQPAIAQDAEPQTREDDWEPAHDPINKAFDPNETD